MSVLLAQGDDALNVHSQYGQVVQASTQTGSTKLWVGPHRNGDATTWASLFARPVFRAGDTVVVRTAPGLRVAWRGRIAGVQGDTAHPPIVLTLELRGGVMGEGAAGDIKPGDTVETLSAMPASVHIANCSFGNSRASGIILESSHALVEGNHIHNTSSAGVSSGGYWSSFSESPAGSDIMLRGNIITRSGLGHRTVSGGSWGGGGAIRISTPTSQSEVVLHRNLSLVSNTVTVLGGEPALEAQRVDGVAIRDNTFCLEGAEGKNATVLSGCSQVAVSGNRCCDGTSFRPC
jgi:hypothetical protein